MTTKAQLRMMVESIPCDDGEEVEVFRDQAEYGFTDDTAIRLSVWGGVLGGGVYARPAPTYHYPRSQSEALAAYRADGGTR